jgi:hypothetical protein
MPANYVLLEKITVGAAGASSVTFSGIPQTGYTDLKVVVSSRDDRASAPTDGITLTFNTSTSVTSGRGIFGDGSSAYSDTDTIGGYSTAASATALTFSNGEFYIPNYTSTNNKSISVDAVGETNATLTYMQMRALTVNLASAITSIKLAPTLGTNFAQYSTFYLYGVAKLGTTPAIVPYATGGDTIMTDGTYWYHTFLSSGTFTPAKGLSCDYLVVAGGGGGAGAISGAGGQGGGGAGGLRSTVTATGGGGSLESKLSLSATSYTVTIGAGGVGGSGGGYPSNGVAGSNTVFSTITSLGGGFGGVHSSTTWNNNGGSGGGKGYGSGAGGVGTTGQGYDGGAGDNGPQYNGGGGGGAGAQGGNSTGGGGGSGGNGVQITAFANPTQTGVNNGYYAGGGSGGTLSGSVGIAGLGGGGTAGNGANATPGIANTGGGGGGQSVTGSFTGGNGGSGIVVVRYAV